MDSHLRINTKFIFLTFIYTFYIISSAANILIIDWIIDLNFAKIGLVVVIAGLLFFIRKDSLRLLRPLIPLFIVIFLWVVVQLVGDVMGLFPKSSLKYSLRFISVWGVAVLTSVVLIRDRKNGICAIVTALVISFILITIIWNIESTQPQYFAIFLNKMPDSFWQIYTVGLYLNPNELGFALVAQSVVLLWWSLHQKGSIVVIPFTLVLGFWGVLASGSRSSLIGLILVTLLVVIAYLLLWKDKISKKRLFLVLAGILLLLMIAIVPGSSFFPERTQTTLKNTGNAISGFYQTGSYDQINKHLIEKDDSIKTRLFIWREAWIKWEAKRWFGLGVRGLKSSLNPTYTPHNFVYSILIEQGVLGFLCMILFIGLIIKKMNNIVAALSIPAFGSTMLFDDLSWSYTVPVYSSLLIGYWFFIILSKHEQNLP
ncbi:O-antigen ligase family protein [bacterium]|nr:O-antigen ligase family protein [bacterium]